jgi:formylglycine-generating enzyme required for sulfatase activity
MNIKTAIIPTAVVGAMMLVCAQEQQATVSVPEVKSVTMSQSADRRVTVTYTMDNAPAVVTLDIQTNCVVDGETVWASIGGQAICNAKGAVWRKVSESDAGDDGKYSISWRPDLSWPDHKIAAGGARAVVTAWALDNTPDYMVVDLSASAEAGSQNYYPSADFLPGGLLGNPDYRTTSLVMRKIMAKGVTWTMGSTSLEKMRKGDREALHKVTLDNNYYIGVFEVTQGQWATVGATSIESTFNNPAFRAKRPMESVNFKNDIRGTEWPAEPSSSTFLGELQKKSGLDFDLPSEAQWEYAARAGNGSTTWGDGSGIWNTDEDVNLDKLGRYQYNGGMIKNEGGGYVAPENTCTPENGTAIVGSYDKNDWGLYDMHGNVYEWCLDWWTNNITDKGGAVNTDNSSGYMIIRGGSYLKSAGDCRPAFRELNRDNTRLSHVGFRVVCTAGLK